MNGQPIVAVTGATGHLGNVVCRQLCAEGYRVRALCRSDAEALSGLPLEIVPGNVLDPDALDRLLDGCDAVIHCAAVISIDGDPGGVVFRTNTEGPANVLAAAKKHRLRRIVHISSVHATLEEPHSEPFDENRPYKQAGTFAYDYSKARGEQILLEGTADRNPELVILRPSSIVGPFDFKPSEIGRAMMLLRAGNIPALPKGGYDFVDVRDVARSAVRALHAGESGSVYLATGRYRSMQEFGRIVDAVSGKKRYRLTLPYWLLRSLLPLIRLWSSVSGARPLFTRESIDAVHFGHPDMNHSKAARELGHTCRPLEETIRDFFTWQQNQRQTR